MLTVLTGVAALLLPQAQPAESPRAVMAAAVSAVSGDSADALRATWARRLTRNPGDRIAQLGLATLARLTFRYQESDSLYALLTRSGVSDPVGRYALLGLGEGLAARGLSQRAGEVFALAEAAVGSDRIARAQALLGLAAALSRTQRDAAADSILAVIDPLLPTGQPLLEAEYRCARAGPPLGPGELEEGAEAMLGARLARQAGDHRLESRCLLGVAKAHYRARRQDSALAASQEAARLARASHDLAGLAATLQWRGYARLTSGDYGGAWHELNEAHALAEQTGSLGTAGAAAMYLSSLALRFGDPILARAQATQAESLLTEAGNQRTLGALRSIQADIARALGDTAMARRMYLDIIAGSGRFGGFGAVAPYRSLAAMARRQGEWAQAESLLALAQVQARTHGMQEWDQRLWYDRGAVALARGDHQAAERSFRRFLAGLTPAQQARGYAARVRLAEVAAQRGDLSQAQEWLVLAADSLDALRSRLNVPALRLQSFQIRDDEADPDLGFATVVAALAEAGRAEAAFALVERRRGRELADQLIRGLALRRFPDDSIAPAPPATIPLSELQQELGSRMALVTFVTGRGGEPTTVFVIHGRGLTTRRLPPIDSLSPALIGFAALVEHGDPAPMLAARLGQILFGVAIADLPGEIDQLILVPDEGLYRLPFDGLILADGQMVLERFVTSQLPSATLLVRLRRVPPRHATGLLAFGDPPTGGDGDAALLRAALGEIGSLERLPAARSEARDAARYASPGTALVGSAATEAALKRLARRQRMLHFAVHAVVNDHALTRTALLLAPAEAEDGIVVPGEVAALGLDADLVVLSACRTASGVTLAGEGVRGLIAPFLEAGARAVVGNTWEVGDRGARTMMRKLYDGLADGLTVGSALRRARLEARREGLEPGLWAGFVLTGDPGVVVPLRHPTPSRLWLMALAAAMVGGVWWLRGRMRPRPLRPSA